MAAFFNHSYCEYRTHFPLHFKCSLQNYALEKQQLLKKVQGGVAEPKHKDYFQVQ